MNDPTPNPSSGRAQFELILPAAGEVRLTLVDVTGRLIAVAHDGRLEAGRQRIVWDGRDAQGGALSAGIYYARLQVDGRVLGRRSLVVVR